MCHFGPATPHESGRIGDAKKAVVEWEAASQLRRSNYSWASSLLVVPKQEGLVSRKVTKLCAI
jgi:hypothetical protein